LANDYVETRERLYGPDPDTIARVIPVYGELGRFAVLTGDEKVSYAQRAKQYIEQHQPVGILEEELVRMIYDNAWRINRAAVEEQRLWAELDRGRPGDGHALTKVNAYAAARERTMFQAIRELNKRQEARLGCGGRQPVPQAVSPADLLPPSPADTPFQPQTCETWRMLELFLNPQNPLLHPPPIPEPQPMSFYTEVLTKDPRFTSVDRIHDPLLLEPFTRAAVEAVIAGAKSLGIDLILFETFRSDARQRRLFEQKATEIRTAGVHHFGLACDLVKSVNGQPSWDGDFSFLGTLARAHGLIWGGDWGEPDKPHHLVDAVHLQRCSLTRQPSLLSAVWYPDDNYNPYREA
jgi:hypothetical protein